MKLDSHKNIFVVFFLCIGLFAFLPEANAQTQTKIEILPLNINSLKGSPTNPVTSTSTSGVSNANSAQLVMLLQSLTNAIISLQNLSPSAGAAYSSTLITALQTIQQYLNTGSGSTSTPMLPSVDRKYSDMLNNAEEAYLVLESVAREAVNSNNSKFSTQLADAKRLYDLAKADFSAKNYEGSYAKAIESIKESHDGIVIAQKVVTEDLVDHAADVIGAYKAVVSSKTVISADVYYMMDVNFANTQLTKAQKYLTSAEKYLTTSDYRLALNEAKLAIETITVAKSLLDWNW